MDSLIKKGDPLDKRLQATEALEYYLPALKLEPDNVELLDRIARQYRHLMSDAPDKKEKLRLGHISLDYAKNAARPRPEQRRSATLARDQLRENAPLHGQRRSDRRLSADQSRG